MIKYLKCVAGVMLVCGLSLQSFARTLEISASVSYQGTAAGSGRTFSVTSDTQWHAWSNHDWITVAGGYPSVTGNGTVTYGFESNAGRPARSGTITVAGGGVERTFTLHQSASAERLTLSSYEVRVGRRGRWNAPYLTVDVESNVDWTVTSHSSWIGIVSSASGSGNGFVAYRVHSSDQSYARMGSFTVSGGGITRTFFVYQDAYGIPASFLHLNRTTEAMQYFGGVAFAVNSNLDWTATPDHAWITVSRIRDSTDDWNFVDLYVQPNRGNQPRVGSVTVRGAGRSATFTITQAAMPYIYILPPKSRQHNADTHDMQVWSFTVRANTDWESNVSYPSDSPTDQRAWIELAGFTGSGNGQQQYVVSANPREARNAWIGVFNASAHAMSDTFAIDQYEAHLEIFPEDRYHPHTASVDTEIDVTATVSWQATSDRSWITIMAGSSGSGDGTIRYDLSLNNALNYRTGTITVVGGDGLSRTYSVVQGGLQPSELSLSPTEREHNHELQGAWTFRVRANVPWKVSAPGLVLLKTASGSGNGTIEYGMRANTGARNSGNIIVTGGGLTREFAVSQAAHPSLITIPAAWLRTHGLPEDGTRNLEDITGKGTEVYQDWIANTNPHDYNDRFIVFTAEKSGSGVTLHWQGKAGRKYLFYRSSATNPLNQASPWEYDYISSWGDPFYTVSCYADGPMSYRIPHGSLNSRYYRIGVKIVE